jgi:hypothetical protein
MQRTPEWRNKRNPFKFDCHAAREHLVARVMSYFFRPQVNRHKTGLSIDSTRAKVGTGREATQDLKEAAPKNATMERHEAFLSYLYYACSVWKCSVLPEAPHQSAAQQAKSFQVRLSRRARR